MKYFTVSPGRTGTRTLHHAMKILGFTSTHYPGLGSLLRTRLSLLDNFDHASDTEIGLLYSAIAARYPDARFIVLTRDPHDWVASKLRHNKQYPKRSFDFPARNAHQWGRLADELVSPDYDHPSAEAFANYMLFWVGQASALPDRFLLFDVATDSWPRLCTFVDRPVPDQPFPHRTDGGRRERPTGSS